MKKEEPITVSARNEVQLAVMSEKIKNIESNVSDIKTSISGLQHSIDDGYAKKAELEDVRADVRSVQSQISWAVKIVLGVVITGVLGLLYANR